MEKEQQELYTANAWQLKEHLDDGNKIQILSALTRLRQICCDPHLIYEKLQGTVSEGYLHGTDPFWCGKPAIRSYCFLSLRRCWN